MRRIQNSVDSLNWLRRTSYENLSRKCSERARLFSLAMQVASRVAGFRPCGAANRQCNGLIRLLVCFNYSVKHSCADNFVHAVRQSLWADVVCFRPDRSFRQCLLLGESSVDYCGG